MSQIPSPEAQPDASTLRRGSLKQWRSLCTWVCAICPSVLLFLLLTMALHVRLGLGHWPKPMVEGYDSFFFGLHDDVVGCMFLFSLYGAGLLWLLMVCVPQLRLSLKSHCLQCAAFFGGWLVIFLAGRFDPTPFTEWLLD